MNLNSLSHRTLKAEQNFRLLLLNITWAILKSFDVFQMKSRWYFQRHFNQLFLNFLAQKLANSTCTIILSWKFLTILPFWWSKYIKSHWFNFCYKSLNEPLYLNSFSTKKPIFTRVFCTPVLLIPSLIDT